MAVVSNPGIRSSFLKHAAAKSITCATEGNEANEEKKEALL
jgi:hypothetical protein